MRTETKKQVMAALANRMMGLLRDLEDAKDRAAHLRDFERAAIVAIWQGRIDEAELERVTLAEMLGCELDGEPIRLPAEALVSVETQAGPAGGTPVDPPAGPAVVSRVDAKPPAVPPAPEGLAGHCDRVPSVGGDAGGGA